MIFSCLRVYKSKFLLVYDSKSLILLNPEKTTIDAGLSTMKILSIAINKDEIFILEGLRKIRRIAFNEDPFLPHEYSKFDE